MGENKIRQAAAIPQDVPMEEEGGGSSSVSARAVDWGLKMFDSATIQDEIGFDQTRAT